MPGVVQVVLRYFSAEAMRLATFLFSKRSRVASALAAGTGHRVPHEAAYHFQMFTVLRQWLTIKWKHADVLPEADVNSHGMPRGFADILIIARHVENPRKHIIELVASTSHEDVQEHYTRTISYMAAHATDFGTCITFTAVASAADTAVDHSLLAWPSPEQLAKGLVVIHVVHDLAWTASELLLALCPPPAGGSPAGLSRNACTTADRDRLRADSISLSLRVPGSTAIVEAAVPAEPIEPEDSPARIIPAAATIKSTVSSSPARLLGGGNSACSPSASSQRSLPSSVSERRARFPDSTCASTEVMSLCVPSSISIASPLVTS